VRAHAVDEAARHWLSHRKRADRARALTLYLDGSHHSGVLTVAEDPELTTRIIELAHDDGGHVVDAVYYGAVTCRLGFDPTMAGSSTSWIASTRPRSCARNAATAWRRCR
jgi:hypothetical protein